MVGQVSLSWKAGAVEKVGNCREEEFYLEGSVGDGSRLVEFYIHHHDQS